MGYNHLSSSQQRHEATDGLVTLFTKANRDLNLVQNQLEKEFQQIYPDHANPMMLVTRIKKIQEELVSLKEQCQELLAAKQDLIDKATTTIIANRSIVQRMQASVGIPTLKDDDDPAFTSFNKVVDEWAAHVRSRTGHGHQNSESEDINKLLFSAIVHNN